MGEGEVSPQLDEGVRLAARAVLGAIACTHPEGGLEVYQAVRGVICGADLGPLSDQLLFRAIEELVDEGEPLDMLSVATRAKSYERSDVAWKLEDPLRYLAEHCAPTALPNVELALAHARTVARAAAEYRAQLDGAELAELAKRDPAAFAERLAALATEYARPAEEEGRARPQWLSAADRARRVGQAVERLPFSLETLNRATRGGLAPAKVVAIGGPPGGGKTSLLMQEALTWARAGHLVGILAADEEADGLVIRLGQQLGIDRGALEAGFPTARAELAEALEQLPNLLLVDSEEEDGATIEAVALELVARRQEGQHAVLILDSLQTVQPDSEERQARDVRERIDQVVKLMKRLARRHRLIVIATSEVSRGSYNTSDKNRQTSPLAAFKESGGIEYGVALALVLSKFKDDSGTGIEVTTAKNRLGGHDDLPVFRLQMSARTATFHEIEMPTDEEKEKADSVKFEKMRTHVLRVIETAKVPLTSKNLILDRLKGSKDDRGKPLGANRSDWLKVIADLEDGGWIKQEGKGKPYVLVE